MNSSSNKNKETLLFLIDNACKGLKIANISTIVKANFPSIKFILINHQLVEKDKFENYLPISTSSSHLNVDNLTWKEVNGYSDLVLLTNKYYPSKELKILALYYRIITGKSIIVIKDGISPDPFFEYYPFILTVYTVQDGKKYQLPEIDTIQPDQMLSLKNEIINDLKNFCSLNTYTVNINYEQYNKCFVYVLNGGDYRDFFKNQKFENEAEENDIQILLSKLTSINYNSAEFGNYNAQFASYKSLSNKLQVSIPSGNDTQIFVYKTNAADFNFRNLKFKNVLIKNSKIDKDLFVLPFYKDEHSTGQTVRLLIMFIYDVHNDSALVDMILLYLFIKVSSLSDKFVKLKYENIARFLLKRYGKDKYLEFLKENRCSILSLKKYFKELDKFLDEEDLYALFDDFVSSDFMPVKNVLIEPFDVEYYDESDLESNDLIENQLGLLPEGEKTKDQEKLIEINDNNWPFNQNYTCDDKKLQLNSSIPFYICIKTFEDFAKRLNQIKWMKSVVKYTDKLVLKGDAILYLLTDRIPINYELVNIGMTNEEFLDFLSKFIEETKPKSVQFIPNARVSFRIQLENNDFLELILNDCISRENLFVSSYLPDQICFLPTENRLIANEYTLWALNYGYCQLSLETHPKSMFLSSKLNKFGFNFYYNDQFKNKTKFLKERLERYVWSITQSSSCPVKDTCNKLMITKVHKKKIFAGEKQIFINKKTFMYFINSETNKNDSNVKVIDFKGAIILPEKKISSLQNAKPLDWSF